MTFETPLVLGDEVLVVFEQDGERVSLVAAATAVGDGIMTVTFPMHTSFPPGPPLTVLTGSGGFSRYASVMRAARNGSSMSIAHGVWRKILNRRASPRYPVILDCGLVADGFRVEGRCVDLAERGVAIEVAQWSAPSFTLEVAGLAIPCRTVSVEPLPMMDIVHAAFSEPTKETLFAIRDLVEQARLEFTAGQRQLAHGSSRSPDWGTNRISA